MASATYCNVVFVQSGPEGLQVTKWIAPPAGPTVKNPIYIIFWGPRELLVTSGKNYRFQAKNLPGDFLTSLDSAHPLDEAEAKGLSVESVAAVPLAEESSPPEEAAEEQLVPAAVNEAVPAAVNEAPAAVNEAPAAVNEAVPPAAVNEAALPPAVNEAPPAAVNEAVPPAVNEAPAIVNEAPPAAEEEPIPELVVEEGGESPQFEYAQAVAGGESPEFEFAQPAK